MIVDSSPLVAVAFGEHDAPVFQRVIADVPSMPRISAANFLEAAIVVDGRRDPILSSRFDEYCLTIELVIEPVTEEQTRIARQAYRDYGRGGGHPAQLNFGDCFAYALSRATGEPLLFKGDDFGHTDIRSALA